MSKTRKVQLEIYDDKVTDFYLALLHWKTSDKTSMEVLKTIADAIYFDEDSIENGIEISPAQKERMKDRMHSIQEYLFNSKKDSKDYFKVSKENLESFNVSPFGKELYGILYSMEVRKLLTGREESIEAKVSVAVFTKFIASLMNAFAATIKLPLFEEKKGTYKIKTDKNGYLLYEFGEGEYIIEAGLFFETSKGIKHIHPLNDLLLLSEEDISTIFLTLNDDAIRLSEKDKEICVTIYEYVKIENGYMYISNATFGPSFSIPKELLKNGELLQTDVFKSIEKEFTGLLKLPLNIPDQIEGRNRDIMIIYDLLKRHYPDITQHTACTTTGYIASSVGLLDSEGIYNISDRMQPFRKYLEKFNELSPKPVEEENKTIIVSAMYGADNGKWIDVKSRIEAFISGGQNEFDVSNEFFDCVGVGKDPAHGHQKKLKMEYEINGKKEVLSALEGAKVIWDRNNFIF